MVKRTKEQISYNMSRIRSRDTSIEKIFGSALRRAKIRYRGNVRGIFGKPDFVVYRKKVAIFCDSAFWHGYRFCRTNAHRFKRRKGFWERKITNNMERDRLVNLTLKSQGWKVLRFWDFKIKKDAIGCICRVTECIKDER